MKIAIPIDPNRPVLVTESYPPTTGSDVQRQFARMKARLVARYQLAAVSGRPEELIRPSTSRGVSLGYGCKTIRLRLMEGREWVSTTDFQVSADDRWRDELDRICDGWFEFHQVLPEGATISRYPEPKRDPWQGLRRAIRDNPQA